MLIRLLRAMSAWAIAILAGIGLIRLPVRPEHRPSDLRPPPFSEQPVTYPRLKHLLVGIVFLAFGLWLLVQFATLTLEVLVFLTMSIVFATGLRPVVDRLSSCRLPLLGLGLPRPLAILAIYLAIASILVGTGFLVVPGLVSEVQQLTSRLPQYAQYLSDALAGLSGRPFVPDLSRLQDQLVSQLAGAITQAVNLVLFLARLVISFFSLVIVLVITFFLLMDAQPLYEHLLSLAPPASRDHLQVITEEMGVKVVGWLKGIFLLSAFIGVGVALGMWALGMPYPLILGLLAGLFEMVPLLGAYLGAAPAVAIALFQPPWKLVAVVIFFFMIQQVENNVLAPAIMGREVEMPPLLAIVALLIGAALYGILGALLALPVAAALQVLWLRLVVPEIRRRNGEEP